MQTQVKNSETNQKSSSSSQSQDEDANYEGEHSNESEGMLLEDDTQNDLMEPFSLTENDLEESKQLDLNQMNITNKPKSIS